MNEPPLARVGLICFVADPFDPPGFERFGGGHLFIFDLGRYLVQRGFQVSFITRLNADTKPEYELLGPRCDIHRLKVGPSEEIPPQEVGRFLDELSTSFENRLSEFDVVFDTIHSHYWIAGEVVRRSRQTRQFRHVHSVLSLGRLKPKEAQSPLRDACEVRVFNSADILLTVCDNELDDLKHLYPEVTTENHLIVPYGVDPDVFFARPQSEYDFVRRQTRRFEQRLTGVIRCR